MAYLFGMRCITCFIIRINTPTYIYMYINILLITYNRS